MKTEKQLNWNEIFVAYSEPSWNSLFRFSMSLCKDEAEAEDLTQQTLLKALQAVPSFFNHNYSAETPDEARQAAEKQGHSEVQTHLLNWLLKICKNTFLDSRNSARRKLNHMTIEDWEEDPDETQAVSNAGHPSALNRGKTGDNSLQSEETTFFEQALDDEWKERFQQLNARQRSIVYLAAEDYSYKEIAQLLEIPMGTVMSTLSRALGKLKKKAVD